MTLASPLPLTSLYDLLRIEDVSFKANWNQERSLDGGGNRLVADRAPMTWMADITTVPMAHAEAEGIMAVINSLGGGLLPLLLTNPKMPYPSSDPDGVLFGSATPVVGTITDRRHVAFTGFPANYTLPLGTWFQVVSDTSRYYLGQFSESRTADGSGAVASVTIAPPFPDSVAEDDAVTVMRPAGKFTIIENTAFPKTEDTIFSRVQFSAEQTYAP